MAESRDIVLKITADNKAAKKDLQDTERSLNANQKALQDLNREYKKGKIATDDYSKAVDGLTKENSELLLQQKQQDKNIKQNAKSVQELRNRYKQLRETANALNTSTKEGQARFKKLTEEAYATQEQIRDFDRSVSGSNTLVGEYTRGILDAAKQQQVFGVSIGSLSGGIGKANKSILGTSKMLNILKIAIASTGIGALVIALGAFITALTQSNFVIEKVQVALAGLKAGFDVIVGVVEKIAKGAFEAFSALLDGDFSGAAEAASKAIDDVAAATENLTEKIADAVKEGAELKQLEINYQNLNRASQLLVLQLEKERAIQEGIRDDATKSFAEREAAAEKLRQANIKRANEELAIAQRNLEIVNKNNARIIENGEQLNNEQKDQFLEAQRAFTEAEIRKVEVLNENNKEINQLRQDRLERDLDILIDGFDNQKTINERKLKDEQLTFQQRQAIIDETARLADESFDKQVKTLQEQTGYS